jgi:hypothetical protein
VRLYLSTVILTLAWFSTLNIMSSALVWLIVRELRRFPRFPQPGVQWLFALRVAPSAVSLIFALGVFLPVHWLYEGREGSEYFGALLWFLALFAVALIAGSAWRVVVALRACRRLRRTWVGPIGQRRAIVSDCEMPGMSLAGIVRTTIVVGRQVREALTREELEVAVAHEVAHRQSWDNAKRFVIFASPDVLRFTRAANELEQDWCAEVECLADARAVDGDASRATNLASALVKVARLVRATSGAVPAGSLWSTFYEEALLEQRVRRLVSGPAVPARLSWLLSLGAATAVFETIALIWFADIPRTVHFMTEVLVGLLP